MAGVFPDISIGGVIVRDAAGTATNPPGILNAYIAPATFTISCAETLYGVDCATLRWRPELHNGVVSELIALAVAINPTGTWSCNANNNLAVNFTAWRDSLTSGRFMADAQAP